MRIHAERPFGRHTRSVIYSFLLGVLFTESRPLKKLCLMLLTVSMRFFCSYLLRIMTCLLSFRSTNNFRRNHNTIWHRRRVSSGVLRLCWSGLPFGGAVKSSCGKFCSSIICSICTDSSERRRTSFAAPSQYLLRLAGAARPTARRGGVEDRSSRAFPVHTAHRRDCIH